MMGDGRLSFFARWAAFTAERFPPASHVLMAASFFAGNAAAAAVLTGVEIHAPAAICGGLATLLIFFRLRVFDEIKDAQTDRELNPGRPLARALISLQEAWRVALCVGAAEAALELACGLPAFASWLVVLSFSLLMFREFFIGAWLRPRMELYAVTHTLVAGWMGMLAASTVSGLAPWQLPAGIWCLVLANWAVFNVFEFARKTWGSDEEKPGVDSYSARLRPMGAALLAMSQVVLAAAGAYLLLREAAVVGAALPAAAMVALTGVASAVYVSRPLGWCAKAYRGTMSFFIVAYYLVVAACIFLGGLGS